MKMSSTQKYVLLGAVILLVATAAVYVAFPKSESSGVTPAQQAQLALASRTYIVGTITGESRAAITVDAQVPDLSVPLTKQGDAFVPALKTVSYTVKYTAATHFTGALTEGAVVKAESATPIEGTTFTAIRLIIETP